MLAYFLRGFRMIAVSSRAEGPELVLQKIVLISVQHKTKVLCPTGQNVLLLLNVS